MGWKLFVSMLGCSIFSIKFSFNRFFIFKSCTLFTILLIAVYTIYQEEVVNHTAFAITPVSLPNKLNLNRDLCNSCKSRLFTKSKNVYFFHTSSRKFLKYFVDILSPCEDIYRHKCKYSPLRFDKKFSSNNSFESFQLGSSPNLLQVPTDEKIPVEVANSSLLFPDTVLDSKVEVNFCTSSLTANQPLFSEKDQIHQSTVATLEKNGISRMTPIQADAFDYLYKGFDMIGRSETGSGKTLAFLLPLFEKLRITHKKNENIEHNSRGRSPTIIILEPTRELAKQVALQADLLASTHQISVLCCYGGTSYLPQELAFSRGVDILIGTPGRIIDHVEKGNLSLKSIGHLVLDEADEMLNMGFSIDIETILSKIETEKCQMIFFSATTPGWVMRLAGKYLKNPVKLDIGEESNRIPSTVKHNAIKLPNSIPGIAAILEDIIAVESKGGQTIVFVKTKREADELLSAGAFKTFSGAALHGDIGQATRDHTMQGFRKGMFKVLVATDVAARGIDVDNVDLIIQCGPPTDSNTYIHRSGRTGRAGRDGTSIVLYSDEDIDYLQKLEHDCAIRFERKLPPSLKMALSASATLAARGLDSVSLDILPYFSDVANDVLKRAHAAGISDSELISRFLAVISKKKKLDTRSLLNGALDMITVEFCNERKPWKNNDDVLYWLNRVAEKSLVRLPKNFGVVYIDPKSPNCAFLDIPVHFMKPLLNVLPPVDKSTFSLGLRVIDELPQLDAIDLYPVRKGYLYRHKDFGRRMYTRNESGNQSNYRNSGWKRRGKFNGPFSTENNYKSFSGSQVRVRHPRSSFSQKNYDDSHRSYWN